MTKTLITSTLVSTILMLLIKMMSKDNSQQKSPNSLSPFECGINQMETNRTPFSNQFFLVAILFLIFDVEISLILPYPLMKEINTPTQKTMTLFLICLLLGLAHEWKKGALQWAN